MRTISRSARRPAAAGAGGRDHDPGWSSGRGHLPVPAPARLIRLPRRLGRRRDALVRPLAVLAVRDEPVHRPRTPARGSRHGHPARHHRCLHQRAAQLCQGPCHHAGRQPCHGVRPGRHRPERAGSSPRPPGQRPAPSHHLGAGQRGRRTRRAPPPVGGRRHAAGHRPPRPRGRSHLPRRLVRHTGRPGRTTPSGRRPRRGHGRRHRPGRADGLSRGRVGQRRTGSSGRVARAGPL